MPDERNILPSSLSGLADSPELVLLVQHALESDPELARAPIDIVARGTQITLLGRAPSETVRQNAERAARAVAGVTDVINRIEL